VLAGLAAAGVLVGGGTAQAGTAPAGSPRWTAGAPVEAGPATAKAARKPLRAERRTDVDAIVCGTSVEYPGGSTITITVTHKNCSDAAPVLTPTASASDGSGTITYASACQEFLPGEAWSWKIAPDLLSRRPTFIYRVTECV
jgi:hypothetical protein